MGAGGQSHDPALGKKGYSFYRRLGGPLGLSGVVPKNSPTFAFDPRTVQLVASCYTDYVTPALFIMYSSLIVAQEIKFLAIMELKC